MNVHIFVPRVIDLLINDDIVVQTACCGAESSHIRYANGNIIQLDGTSMETWPLVTLERSVRESIPQNGWSRLVQVC